MTKPMKTEHLAAGEHGKSHADHGHGNPHHTPPPTSPPPPPPPPPVSGVAALSAMTNKSLKMHDPKPKLTPEDYAAGKTPNSGKLKKDGSPVPGQDAAHDAERAAERAAEAAVPEVTPAPTPPPVV